MTIEPRKGRWPIIICITPEEARLAVLLLFSVTLCVAFLMGKLAADQFLSVAVGVLAAAGILTGRKGNE